MPIDVIETMQHGGREWIEFLHFCIFTREPAPLFVFCAREYRFRPTPAAAIALYDVFCAPGSPARIRADSILPPLDPRMERHITTLREELRRFESPFPPKTTDPSADGTELRRRPPQPNPVIHLFDHVVTQLMEDRSGAFHAPGLRFDPERTAFENLPGGVLSAGQRAFVDNVWRPHVRPRLLSAGFHRVSNLGQ